jgi:A/G-specific adenine glycosylase
MWTEGVPRWYSKHGRHQLPWRHTLDPWAVLVSEVMLQQTSVARVLPRWSAFLERWPAAADCAGAGLDEVLREWQGLGYPRRARALWLTARVVSAEGWPAGEAGLRLLPGVGAYTARALLAFSSLTPADQAPTPPRDVNLARVAARAGLGLEPHEARPSALDEVLRVSRPAGMPVRDYGYALFDVGALHCRARPRCHGCPVAAGCAALQRVTAPAPPPRRQSAYAGSLRQLRGALLAAALRAPAASPSDLADAVAAVAGSTPERVTAALDGLMADGLLGRAAIRGGNATGRGSAASRG